MSAPGSAAVRARRDAAGTRTLPPNDPRLYDDLVDEWWRPDGPFAMLHWLAEARARLIPPASRADALLVDVGCGAGLLAPHVGGKGYRHVGVDLVRSALVAAADHGVTPIRGDAAALPLADGCADVVAAGELLEHLPDLPGTVAEVCRILRPGGLLVLDTLNATALSRLLAVRIAERLPGIPRGIHDPWLFVDPGELITECARHGVRLRVRGLRPVMWRLARWLIRIAGSGAPAAGLCSAEPERSAGFAGTSPLPGGRGGGAPAGRRAIVPTWSTAVLYQGLGVKEGSCLVRR